MTRALGLSCIAAQLAFLATGCASDGGAPGPVSDPPKHVAGETLRGPAPDAEVVAATVEPPPADADRLDWNGDRHVDREEFRNFFTRAFHHADADDDRLIRGDELAQLPVEAAKQADRNGDGALDVDEYVGMTLVWFDRCDRNEDDVLGSDEEQACSEAETKSR